MPSWNTIAVKAFITLLSVSCICDTIQAQENSPYSRYALGNLKRIENVANRGMGGIGIADPGSFVVNPANPASFSFMKLTAYQAGVEGSSINVQNKNLSNRTGGVTLEYINLAFPVGKNFGISFGLLPFTRAKYNMAQSDSLSGISRVDYKYYGGGATQRVYLGAAYRYKEFSFGLMGGYTFGNLIYSSEANYTDTLKILSNSVTSRTTVGGFFLQWGALSRHVLNDKNTLCFGITGMMNGQLRASQETFWKSFTGSVSNPDYQYDVDSILNNKGRIKIPTNWGAGILFSHQEQWKAGIDYSWSNWNQYRSYNQPDSTGTFSLWKAGIALTPDPVSKNEAWKKATYRAGAYIGTDMFQFNGNSLPVRGVTFGLGYPIRRTLNSIGQINVAFDLGSRGTTDQNLLRENYTRFSIGVTFNDKWFIPRKYE